MARLLGACILEGSWDLVSNAINRVKNRITPLRGLIAPIITYLLSPMILQVILIDLDFPTEILLGLTR